MCSRPLSAHLHTVEVVGSNPAVPTIINNLATASDQAWLQMQVHLLRTAPCGEHRVDRSYHLLHAFGKLLYVLIGGRVRS